MNKEEQYDLIERHLRKELTGEEARQVEELIVKDIVFARELDLHKEIHYVIADKGLDDFRQKVKEASEPYVSLSAAGRQAKNAFPFYLKIAAAITLLIGTVTIFYLIQPEDQNDLFAKYFTPYEAPMNFRSDGTSGTDDAWKQALAYYDAGKYQEAVPYLEKVVIDKPDNTLAKLLKGVSYLAIGSTAQAEENFSAIIKDGQNMFVEQAKWYLALTYLKEEKTEDAKILLISIESGAYHDNAQELLRSIE